MRIISYCEKTKDLTFNELPINEIDMAVLAQLVYLDFVKIAPHIIESNEGKTLSLKDIDISKESLDNLCDKSLVDKNMKKLLPFIVKSKRFNEIKISHHIDLLIKEMHNQFAALTYILPDNRIIIAFRGTDRTLTGWKEDVLMSYSSDVYAIRQGVRYAAMILKFYPDHPFYLIGHSKGGAIVSKVASTLNENQITRLINAYDFEGPGVNLKDTNYALIKDKLHKYVAHRSVVGLLFNEIPKFAIIAGYGPGGHDLFRWDIDYKRKIIKRKKRLTKFAIINNYAFNMWYHDLTTNQLLSYIKNIIEVLDDEDVYSLIRGLRAKLKYRIKNKSRSNPEKRKALWKAVKAYLSWYLFAIFNYRTLRLKDLYSQEK